MNILSIIEVFCETGLVFSILAMGYYVSYTLLDFPDLTVEGTFLCGAVTYGLLAGEKGVNPWLAILIAFAIGACFGCVTGLLNVKLKIRPLLCGILVSTLLISVNLVATSVGVSGDFRGEGSSIISYGASSPLHNVFPFRYLPAKIGGITFRDLMIYLFVALLCKILLDLFLKTKRGLLLRAAGDNPQYVTSLARDPGNSRILGLAIGNGFAAISGSLYSHLCGNTNQSMGIGMIVIGLASLIIGLSVFSKVKFLKPTTKAIFGAILYQACLTIAQWVGIPSSYNKFIMAVLFTLALVLSSKVKSSTSGKNGKGGKKDA